MPGKIDKTDEKFMRRALALARKGLGRTSPNPMVGAVIVSDGLVIAEGWHKAAGLPHAEADALAKTGGRAAGATIYVNLEPCIHYGKTAPCSPAIAKAGIRRVVVGTIDPNPLVAGKGIAFLNFHGIETVTGVLKKQAEELNRAFFKHVTTGMPWVTLKMAMSLDGRVADRWRNARYISNADSLKWVHKQRAISDAVMVGIGTVLADDPMLTPRDVKVIRPRTRVVLDLDLRIPLESKLVKSTDEAPVIVYHGGTNPKKAADLQALGCVTVKIDALNNKIPVESVLKDLGARDIQTVMVEGGSKMAASIVKDGLWDELAVFVAPKIAADDQAVPVFAGLGPRPVNAFMGMKLHQTQRFGDDILLVYRRGQICLPE